MQLPLHFFQSLKSIPMDLIWYKNRYCLNKATHGLLTNPLKTFVCGSCLSKQHKKTLKRQYQLLCLLCLSTYPCILDFSKAEGLRWKPRSSLRFLFAIELFQISNASDLQLPIASRQLVMRSRRLEQLTIRCLLQMDSSLNLLWLMSYQIVGFTDSYLTTSSGYWEDLLFLKMKCIITSKTHLFNNQTKSDWKRWNKLQRQW